MASGNVTHYVEVLNKQAIVDMRTVIALNVLCTLPFGIRHIFLRATV